MNRRNNDLDVTTEAFHTPLAPYFADTYNTLNSVVQGVVLGALFFAFTEQEGNIPPLFYLKAFLVFLTTCLMWHRYVTHTQWVAWRLNLIDTLIPMGFAVTQLFVIWTMMKNSHPRYFSQAFTVLTIMGTIAYWRALSKVKSVEKETRILLAKHFADEYFGSGFYDELLLYEKRCFKHVHVLALVSLLTTFSVYLPWVEQKTQDWYVTVVLVLSSLVFGSFDLNMQLRRLNKLPACSYPHKDYFCR
ncbi:MAG TPA: hypothetical protein VGJ94_18385 [Syntrophorhabdaceae bacterium]